MVPTEAVRAQMVRRQALLGYSGYLFGAEYMSLTGLPNDTIATAAVLAVQYGMFFTSPAPSPLFHCPSRHKATEYAYVMELMRSTLDHVMLNPNLTNGLALI